ncbi:MAG TPA: VWA domain-containing protein [Chitinophagaceae bacterium]|nr:VWA domain-containing protein [Chitinophagaceae bacterium]
MKLIGDERLVKALISNFSFKRFIAKCLLLLLAFSAGVLALMNLRKPDASSNITRKGIDVAIALDVSKSMLATDLAPNRLERAKQFINKLMDALPDDRFALVVFAGKAYLQMPLTADHGAAKLFVAGADPSVIPQQGTVVADALQMSANAFISTERKFKAVVLLSDGEDHDAGAVAKAKELREQGVMINSVGIGSPEGATIPDAATGEDKKDAAGNVVISRLNEEILKELASVTNGVYTRLQTADEAVKSVKGQLAQIDRKAFGDVSMMNFTTYYYVFAGLMFLLLLMEPFIPEKKKIA